MRECTDVQWRVEDACDAPGVAVLPSRNRRVERVTRCGVEVRSRVEPPRARDGVAGTDVAISAASDTSPTSMFICEP